MTDIRLSVNGRPIAGACEPRTHLADFLRDRLDLTGTHLRCEQGVCGACTVLIDGAPARSCINYAVNCQGAEVTTIEGFGGDQVMSRLRTAFHEEHALQCGFCTPGMLVTARDIVLRLPEANPAQVRTELSGNLCRCTGYAGIVRAICRVLDERRGAAPVSAGRLGPVGARPGASVASERQATPAAGTAPAAVSGTGELGLGGRQPNLETALSFTVRRPVHEVWAVLGDIPRVARCMPGASLSAPPSDGHVEGRMSVKVGPIATNFAGTARIVRQEAEQRGTLYGAGRDGLSGSTARAEVAYALAAAGPDATRIDITLKTVLAGPLAQFGRSGIVKELMARLAEQFARRLEQTLEHGTLDDEAMPEASLRPLALIAGLIADKFRSLFRRAR
ncbi:xanthine dehydrogenase family Fe-S subunit [Ancylobacter mangrovi]|uniref:xanthine dehydrogenase family Fe-S subunit n=1 Tax=Ancylobacter mangrovi TaxID=2972472 RepID=UPI002163CBE3|nr:2Fe-2S iron-sulfur cluster-binding protein [Ancylobacter mangrovi]MCS0503678.1 2Fe-2S iron-sulfur cluster-binding protein [Ancylobacter mangrovi]